LTGSQRAARASAPQRPYAIPLEGVLKQYRGTDYGDIDDETRHAAEMLQITLEEFKIQAEVTGIRKGPVITMFELLPAPGVKLARAYHQPRRQHCAAPGRLKCTHRRPDSGQARGRDRDSEQAPCHRTVRAGSER